MFERQKPYLQKIIGVDKNNPVFTLWRDPESSGGIHVYFGTELMEVVPDDSTIKRWADALSGGDGERLIQALQPTQMTRKERMPAICPRAKMPNLMLNQKITRTTPRTIATTRSLFIRINRAKVSRLEEVIQDEFHRLNTGRKSLLDSMKIIARNMFYRQLEPFRQLYDNYRDDHVILRNLSRADGFVYFGRNTVEVILCPTMQYQPQIRGHIEAMLEQLNAQKPLMPDGSGRTIHFQLKKKTSKLFAIHNASKTGFY